MGVVTETRGLAISSNFDFYQNKATPSTPAPFPVHLRGAPEVCLVGLWEAEDCPVWSSAGQCLLSLSVWRQEQLSPALLPGCVPTSRATVRVPEANQEPHICAIRPFPR